MKMNWITILYCRTLYKLKLTHRKRRLDRIEKKYYKAFPDRVNDHFIATRPIPNVKVTKYHAVTLKSNVRIPRDFLSFDGTETMVKHELFKELEPEISKRIEIHTLMDPEEKDIITYEAYFRFYEED